jgi:hypothetical protein
MTTETATTQDWRTLSEGRELDALIDSRVFGHATRQASECCDRCWVRLDCTDIADERQQIPTYSRTIADAWRLVEWMAARGWKVDVQNRYAPTWACHVHFPAPNYAHVFEHEESAPLAICRAALAAVET